MNERVLDCLVIGYEELEIRDQLPDENDAHVLAAAIKSQSQIIVTFNTKDFPIEVLRKYDIEAQHPDTFLRAQLDLSLPVFLGSVKNIRSRLKNPPMTANQYLFTLFNDLPQTVTFLKQYMHLI